MVTLTLSGGNDDIQWQCLVTVIIKLIVGEDEMLHPNSLLITRYVFKPCIMFTSLLLPGSMEICEQFLLSLEC